MRTSAALVVAGLGAGLSSACGAAPDPIVPFAPASDPGRPPAAEGCVIAGSGEYDPSATAKAYHLHTTRDGADTMLEVALPARVKAKWWDFPPAGEKGRARVEVESEGLRVSAFASLAGRTFQLRGAAHSVQGRLWIEPGTRVELLGRRDDGVVVRANTGWDAPAIVEGTASCADVAYDTERVQAPERPEPFLGATARGSLSLARRPGAAPFAILRADSFRLVVVERASAHVRVMSEDGAIGFDGWVQATDIGPINQGTRDRYPLSAHFPATVFWSDDFTVLRETAVFVGPRRTPHPGAVFEEGATLHAGADQGGFRSVELPNRAIVARDGLWVRSSDVR